MERIKIDLQQKDLPKLQKGLAANLAYFFRFSSCDLYFPDEAMVSPVLLPDESKLFVPVVWADKILGCLLFTGIDSEEITALMPVLIRLASLCTAIEVLHEQARLDKPTGLFNEEYLYQHLEKEVEDYQSLQEGAGDLRPGQFLHYLCKGFIIIKWRDATDAVKIYGPVFVRQVYEILGQTLATILPENSYAAPLGKFEERYEYGAIVPAAGSGACEHKAKQVLKGLEKKEFIHPLTGGVYRPVLSAGYALYPHDMEGEDLRLQFFDQAIRLRDRARLAAELAERQNDSFMTLGFRDILKKGARIVKVYPNGNVRINLGAFSNICEGQRFDVFAPEDSDIPYTRKAQILVFSVESHFSLASTLFVTDTGFEPVAGDYLRIANEDVTQSFMLDSVIEMGVQQKRNEILGYQDFFSDFAKRKDKSFVLGIARFSHERPESFSLAYEELSALPESPEIIGVYGSGSLLFYHPDVDGETVRKFYIALTELANLREASCISGLFPWPFLDFGKGESEINAIKALEYGRLLPEPHIGIFDSLAMTIHADKLYSQGEIYGAIGEYEKALLADENNFMALNSLGVANASLGKLDKARRHFEAALKCCDEPAKMAEINYNLGVVHQQLKNYKEAGACFRQALRDDPSHTWSWVRLGQLAEAGKRKSEAAALYEKALSLENADQQVRNVAGRQLARLKAKQNKVDMAREILHDNLLEDPDNPETLLELAKMYLKNNEDPDMGALLARKSINLGAGSKGWLILAEALELLGRTEEAKLARQTGGQKF